MSTPAAPLARDAGPAAAAARGWPPRLRAVLFDLDGVLIDSARAWHRVVVLGAQRYGGHVVDFETFARTFGQGPDADQRDYFPGCSVARVSAFYAETFPQQLAELRLMPGALTLLQALGERGLRRAVVTNTPLQLAREVLSTQGLAPLLEATAAAGEAPEKPSPALVQLALSRLGVAAAEAVYVGDSASDRGATRAAGVFMLGLRHPADATIDQLDELLAWL
ncbi:MAG: HAD family hydrolase [Proteobacteria bacterium]|nr:HAD family hydrolase [Pseudomonadota bacterium]